MNIYSLRSDDGFSQTKFYIDCPLDVELHPQEIRRIQIPRELANYITKLQDLLNDNNINY